MSEGGFVELTYEVEVFAVHEGPYPVDVKYTGEVVRQGIPPEVARWLVQEAIEKVRRYADHERTVRHGFYGWED